MTLYTPRIYSKDSDFFIRYWSLG
nr:hypothetical protein [Clostridium butyricum]